MRLSQLLIKTENNAVTKYVYGLGLIGEEISGNFKTYHFDYRGSTVAITDSNCNITDTFTYDTYGKLTARTGTAKTPFLYNGRDGVMYEDDTGLYYMRARYYSPVLRRFVNADKVHGDITNALTLNRYSYVNGNPAVNVDPEGLKGVDASGGADSYTTSYLEVSHYYSSGLYNAKERSVNLAITPDDWYNSADEAAYYFGEKYNNYNQYSEDVEMSAVIYSKIFYEYKGRWFTTIEFAKYISNQNVTSFSELYSKEIKKVRLYTYDSIVKGDVGSGSVGYKYNYNVYGLGRIEAVAHTHGRCNTPRASVLFFDSLSDGDIDYANHVSGFNTSETNPLTHTEKRIPWFSIYLCAYDTKHPDEKVLKKYTPYGYDNPNDNIIDKFISDE